MLRDAGFTYSSSVLPARSPLFGDPTLPDHAVPVAQRARRAAVPGRAGAAGSASPTSAACTCGRIPTPASALARRGVGRDQLLWIYCHPYDFDPGEEFWVVPDAGRFGSRLLWYNRRRTFAKIEDAPRPCRPPAATGSPPLAERPTRPRVPDTHE